jgi:3-oxoacyl-[acyl-carrier protein] reductase
MDKHDSVVVVTGGAKGIGAAAVYRFAASGYRVTIWDTDDEAGTSFEWELGSEHVFYQHVDVTDEVAVDSGLQQVISKWNRVDVLINNAGILQDAQLIKSRGGEILDRMSTQSFDHVISVNLRGVFICTRSVAPIMIKQNHGRIINTASVVGIYGNFGQTNYVASKAGVIGMTRVWARELGKYNITVNAVAPGFIETDMVRQMPEKILEMMVERTPLKRLGKPEEIASVFYFLAGDDASYINGAVINVDGGVVIGT